MKAIAARPQLVFLLLLAGVLAAPDALAAALSRG